jgi:hypothetical protein
VSAGYPEKRILLFLKKEKQKDFIRFGWAAVFAQP